MPMLSQTYIGKYYEGSQELSVSTKSIPGQDNDSYVKECCCPKYRAAKGQSEL